MSKTTVLCASPHTHPDPSIFVDMSRKSGPGAGGLGIWYGSPPCLFCLVFYCISREHRALILPLPERSPRRPGGGGLPQPAAAAAAP